MNLLPSLNHHQDLCRGMYLHALVLLAAVAVAGCGRAQFDEQASDSAMPPEGIEKQYDRGPVRLILRTDRKELTIAEKLRFSLLVEAEEDYEVELPGFGEKLESFGIVDYETLQPQLTGQGRIRRGRIYLLEPFLSGEYTIPAMTIVFRRKNEAAAPEHELETEPITVTVTSLLPETMAELDIEPIVGPVQLPQKYNVNFWLLAPAALLGLALATGLVLYKRRSAKEIHQLQIAADEQAYRQLEALIAADLLKKGQVKLFYLKISNILRHYIENRFGLHAPERTTEEFLAELSVNGTLRPQHKKLLTTFLTHCDLVKFAEMSPTKDEIQNTFDSCRTFIAETKPQQQGDQ